MFKQKSKVGWLRLRDGNNAYFHASLKSKRSQTQFVNLKDEDTQKNTANRNLTSIDLVILRKAPQLFDDQREALIGSVTRKEIFSSLKGIKNISAPGIDGFSSKLLKISWDIIKQDTINAIKDFFETKKMYKAINCTLLTLIPKSTTTDMVKDYRLISCCTGIYKIISRIMASRLVKVLVASFIAVKQPLSLVRTFMTISFWPMN